MPNEIATWPVARRVQEVPGVVLARETRSGRIQAIHTGHAIVLDAAGKPKQSWGQPEQATYWRSAAKPFQALPFVASGAAASFDLGDAEIAIACGSHAAEAFHVAAAQRILVTAGLSATDLKCGVHDPGPQAGPIPAGGWTAIHNNCSGKHAAMLATCRHKGWTTDSYLSPEHPLQKEVATWVATATGQGADAGVVPSGVDGCGLPTFFLPIERLAAAFQWLHVSGLPAARRVLEAMAQRPEMLGGTGNPDSDLPRATGGRIVSKYGALGVVGAVNRETGEALAVKMDAGNAQAARSVALAIMADAGWLTGPEMETLAPHVRPVLRNHAGAEVGHVDVQLVQRPQPSGAALL